MKTKDPFTIEEVSKRITRLEKRLERKVGSIPYKNSWHRKHSQMLREVRYLRDELEVENSLLFRLKDRESDE